MEWRLQLFRLTTARGGRVPGTIQQGEIQRMVLVLGFIMHSSIGGNEKIIT